MAYKYCKPYKSIKKPVLGKEKPNSESYRVDNARKVNAKKKPDGYIYILGIDQFDLYKIGVSGNPDRRIRDIRSVLPFTTELLFCKKFLEVYSIEEQIHEIFQENNYKKEWYQVYRDDIDNLIKNLNELQESQIKLLQDGSTDR